ncbi:MAG: hypothetical protein O7G85_07360, partial [Planctomycetota bacterium]|nr:hypothetical protein [Planctomycetota bacterium]
MNVNAVSGFVLASRDLHRLEKAEKPAETKAAEETPVEETLPVESSTKDGEGVMRLLQEGHFKGVAELRHRIRLHDQLAAQASQEAGESLRSEGESLVDTINEGVASLAESMSSPAEPVDGVTPPPPPPPPEGDLAIDAPVTTDDAPVVDAESLLGDFAQSVENTLSGGEDGQVNLDSIETDLRASFDALVSSLHDLYAAPEPVVTETD